MSRNTSSAKIQSDGTVVEILDGGGEWPFPKTPMHPMTDEEVAAAAAADLDARPMTPEQLRTAPHVSRIKTLRRALDLSQEEFAAQFQIPLGTLRDWEQGRVKAICFLAGESETRSLRASSLPHVQNESHPTQSRKM